MPLKPINRSKLEKLTASMKSKKSVVFILCRLSSIQVHSTNYLFCRKRKQICPNARFRMQNVLNKNEHSEH